MVDGAFVQSKIYFGYAQAARVLGLPFNQFRPSGTSNPTSGSPIASIKAQFTAGKAGFNFNKPGDHDEHEWNALVDGRLTQVGDYLVGAPGTWFIAAMQPLLPILAIKCTHTIKVLRPVGPTQAGKNPYGGNVHGTETVILTGWPVWLEKAKLASKTGTEGHLPQDIGERSFEVLLPPVPVQVEVSDIVTDEQNLRYVIAMVEKIDLGLRLTMTQMVT